MMDKYYLVVVILICVTAVNAGRYCTKYNYGSIFDNSIYCSTSCCGDKYNRYCCDGNVGLIVGIVFGVLGLVAIVVTVLVAVFCCCRKSKGRTGQVCQPAGVTTTVPVYGMQTTIVAGPGQVGYTNAAFPQQLQTSNMPGPVDTAPKWQEPPPSYNTVTTN